MADATPESPKRKPAPPRNDMKSSALYKNSRALEMMNQDPDFVYQPFSIDPESPGYIGKKLQPHEIGNQRVGFAMVEGWEVVHDLTDQKVRALDPREDQGKQVDTVKRYGRQVWCRIRKSEHAKYAQVEDLVREDFKKQLFGAPDRTRDRSVSMTSLVSDDEETNHLELLKQSGHPMPGV